MSQTTIQWHLEEGMDDDRFTDVKRGTDTMCVCSGYDRVERYQRAAFIVQACNSHEALVEALKECVERLEGLAEDGLTSVERVALGKGKAALTKVNE